MKDLEEAFKNETGKDPLIAVIGHGKKLYASWEYQKYLEKRIKELEQRLETRPHEPIVMRIREKCEGEIKWVKESLDEHAELGNYTKADEHYLPGYRKAFEEILKMLKNA